MTHISHESLNALLDGRLPRHQTRALLSHLEQPCPTCDAVLEDGPDLDTLARLIEAEAAFAPARKRPWSLPAAALALAAGLLLALGLPALRPDAEKGPGLLETPHVQLRVVAAHKGVRGNLALDRRMESNSRARRDETLLFELETDRRAARYLFVVDGHGQATVLAPGFGSAAMQDAGRSHVTDQGQWVALELSDMQGPITVVGAASAVPLNPETDVVGGWLDGNDDDLVEYAPMVVQVED